jgi:hypothetical protein
MSKEVRMSFREISKIRKDYEKTKRLESKKEDKPSNQKSKKPSISSRLLNYLVRVKNLLTLQLN